MNRARTTARREPQEPLSAREIILRRIREGLQDAPSSEDPGAASVARSYLQRGESPREEVIAAFCERVEDYRVLVRRVSSAELPAAITAALAARQVRRLVVPSELPAAWLPDAVELLRD